MTGVEREAISWMVRDPHLKHLPVVMAHQVQPSVRAGIEPGNGAYRAARAIEAIRDMVE